MRMLLQKILMSHGAWKFSNIYIYREREHLVEIIYTLVGSELLKKKLISSYLNHKTNNKKIQNLHTIEKL